jgi:Tfp pilus assembly protein PilX
MINFIYNKLTGFAKKGIALFMVLGTLLVVTILAFIMLNIILSHSRLTQHQVGRIQAYYAAQAGMNYALEMLRTGAWTVGNSYTWTFDVGDFHPASIVNNSVLITIKPTDSNPAPEGAGPVMTNSAPVIVTVDYTTPP